MPAAEPKRPTAPRWGVAEAEGTAEAILDLFIEGIARRPGPA
jgi:hypothetical protein